MTSSYINGIIRIFIHRKSTRTASKSSYSNITGVLLDTIDLDGFGQSTVKRRKGARTPQISTPLDFR